MFYVLCGSKTVRWVRSLSEYDHSSLLSNLVYYQLGEFEEVVILTTGVLYKNAYGVAIKKEIESRLERSVSMGAMHSALVRLEDKGYIRSFDGEATEERAGRPRKYFQITALGND